MINWDDLRVFIATASSGSFSAAGRRLGIDGTTVTRRIERLETKLRVTLFARSRKGLELTGAGLRLAEAGAGVEAAINFARNEAALNATAGTVRISVPEGFGLSVLAPAATRFLADHPGLELEVITSAGLLSPSTREVDIAITSHPPKSTRLLIEKLADYEVGLYGAPSYLSRRGLPQTREDLEAHDFVGFVDDLLYTDNLRYVDEFNPRALYRMTSSSVRAQILMAASGAGLCALPHFLVEEYGGLVRLLPEIDLVRSYWMASHRELSQVARMRAVRKWLFKIAGANADKFTPSKFTDQASLSIPLNLRDIA